MTDKTMTAEDAAQEIMHLGADPRGNADCIWRSLRSEAIKIIQQQRAAAVTEERERIKGIAKKAHEMWGQACREGADWYGCGNCGGELKLIKKDGKYVCADCPPEYREKYPPEIYGLSNLTYRLFNEYLEVIEQELKAPEVTP